MKSIKDFKDNKLKNPSNIFGSQKRGTKHETQTDITYDIWYDNDNDGKLSVGDCMEKTMVIAKII